MAAFSGQMKAEGIVVNRYVKYLFNLKILDLKKSSRVDIADHNVFVSRLGKAKLLKSRK